MAAPQSLLNVALTGGIASGKTQVSDALGALGASVIDTDVLARDVVAPGTPGLQAIVDTFGDDVLAADGTLDRSQLRQTVFADPAARRELEGITHPRIQAAAAEAAAQATGVYRLFVVPLLVGSSFLGLVDRVLVVDCDRSLQLQRLLSRDDETPEQAVRILDSQATRTERLEIADDVICNNRDLATLAEQSRRLHAFYLSLSGDRPH